MNEDGLHKIDLVFIGHKDHGKSTLIGRLLYDSNAIPQQKLQEVEAELKKAGEDGFRFSFLLDTLEEERRGGLTIDVTHTPFRTKKNLYTIIDCPGHREFIKKMLTGASQADAAVLVVSAKEGIGDQTRQHAFLIKTLGISQLVVVINKMDQVGYDEGAFVKISRLLDDFLKTIGFENVPKVPISAFNGDNVVSRSKNMPWYDSPTFVDTLDNAVKPRQSSADKPLRGCVQDVYERQDGRVVVCKIETGVLEKGKSVCLSPSGTIERVKAIELFGIQLERAKPGDSVGLVMGKVQNIRRGDIISYPETRAKEARSFIAEVILFSGIGMKNGDTCTIRFGTAERKCRVEEILTEIDPVKLTVNATSLRALRSGGVGEVKFVPLEALCIERHSDFPPLGRFVIRGKKGPVGAGIVLRVDLESAINL